MTAHRFACQPPHVSASLTDLRLLTGLLVTLRRVIPRRILHCLLLTSYFLLLHPCPAEPPMVTNVRASQRVGTELVDVCYDVSASVPPLTVAVQVSADGGPLLR